MNLQGSYACEFLQSEVCFTAVFVKRHCTSESIHFEMKEVINPVILTVWTIFHATVLNTISSNIFRKKLDRNVTSAMHLIVKWIPKEAVLDRIFILKLK
jgi:hypothetical protein